MPSGRCLFSLYHSHPKAALRGGSIPGVEDGRAFVCRPAIWGHGQVAVLLIQERVEPLVVARRQVKHAMYRTVTAAGFHQTTIDDRSQVHAGQLTRLERLMDD